MVHRFWSPMHAVSDRDLGRTSFWLAVEVCSSVGCGVGQRSRQNLHLASGFSLTKFPGFRSGTAKDSSDCVYTPSFYAQKVVFPSVSYIVVCFLIASSILEEKLVTAVDLPKANPTCQRRANTGKP